jgi:sugar lactone lactonase YvrE
MRQFSSFIALSLALVGTACAAREAPPAGASAVPEAAAPHLDQRVASTAATRPPAFVARFDQKARELPEGLLVASDAAFVGFAPSSRVVRIALPTGTSAPFGQLPAPVPGKGFMTGLAQDAAGDVYAGLASFAPEVQAGIYRIAKGGGAGVLFAKDPLLPFPNALAFDADGALFATDSATGSVFRIDASGRAERWATGELLTGKKYHCGAGLGPGFDIGANGIVVERDAVYVVNTDKATLVKISRNAAGSSGAASVFAGPDCVQLGGADGLARAADGAFVVAINRQDKLTRVGSDGTVTTIATGAPLDFPASLAFRGPDLYVTNFALFNANAGKLAAPGLLKFSE